MALIKANSSGIEDILINKTLQGVTEIEGTNVNIQTSIRQSYFGSFVTINSDNLELDLNKGVISRQRTVAEFPFKFTNVPTEESSISTISLITKNTSGQVYPSAYSINGVVDTSGGIYWQNGIAPTPSGEIDVLTFWVTKQFGGAIKVFGFASLNYLQT